MKIISRDHISFDLLTIIIFQKIGKIISVEFDLKI